MKEHEVPQDTLDYYLGGKRACYAVDKDGAYKIVTSTGWKTEEIVNSQAVMLIDQKIEAVRNEVAYGKLSPLAYHMAVRQMTPRLLASTLGLWTTWRVKRLLKLKNFLRAKEHTLRKYADALGVTYEDFCQLPENSHDKTAKDTV
jgi:hypothetical protein